MRASQQLLASVEQELKSQGLPPLEWYDILWELERGPKTGIRPLELEGQTLLRQYQMSRVLKRMEAAGHVITTRLESDKRGFMVQITDKGRHIRASMWQSYGSFLRARFDDGLSIQQLTDLSDLLQTLTTNKTSA